MLPCFVLKRFFVKLTTFATAYKTEYEIKPSDDSESTSKIKLRSRWKVFQIFITSAVICIKKVISQKLQKPQI